MPGLRSRVMVGRDAELSRLVELAGEARGGHGSFVLVVGEAGVGKSRLAWEVASRARAEGDTVAIGHGVDLESGELPYAALVDTLRDVVRSVGVDEARGLLGGRANDLSGVLPALGGPGDVWDRARILSAAATLIDGVAEGRPLCWIVEDLQWVDAATRDLVSVVARSAPERSILVLATVRSEGGLGAALPSRVADLQALPSATTVWLHRLEPSAVRQQLDGMGCSWLTARQIDRIVDLSDGLPYFVELLATASEGGGAGIVAPPIGQFVLARRPQLSSDATALLEAAALAQVPLRLDVLTQATMLAGDDFDAAVTSLVEAGVVDWSTDVQLLTFHHALMRESVAASISPPRRQAIHRLWATCLTTWPMREPATVFALAHHWYESGARREALSAACRAAERAAALSDARLEAQYWARALDLWNLVDEPAEAADMARDEILVNLLHAVSATGDWSNLRALCERELSRIDHREDPLGHLWLTLRLRSADVESGPMIDIDEGTLLEWGAFLMNVEPDVRAVECLLLVNAESKSRLPDLARRMNARALEMSDGLTNERVRLAAQGSAAVEQMLWNDHERAISSISTILETRPAGRVVDLWRLENALMSALTIAGRYEEAAAVGERAARRLARPDLVPDAWNHLASNLVLTYVWIGRWEAADELLDRIHTDVGHRLPTRYVNELLLAVRRGDSLGVPELLSKVTGDHPAAGSARESSPVGRALVEGFAFVGDLASVRSIVAAMERTREFPPSLWPAVNAALRAEVSQGPAYGTASERRDSIARLDRLAVASELDGLAGEAYRAEHSALLLRFAGADGPDEWRSAASAWARTGRIWDEAICRLRLGESLVADGDRSSARAELSAALITAKQLRAQPLSEAIFSFSRRARLPLALDTNAASLRVGPLTSREREVLALMVQGRSNREIAAELFISPKTASVHVSRILTKLHAANRTEATTIAHRDLLLD